MARRSSQQWAELVDRWKRSGLTAPAFAAREGLDPGQLSWWKWHLKARAAHHATVIVPVHVVPARRSAVVSESGASPIEIVLPSGAQLRVGRDVEEAALVRVVRAVESACS